MSAPLSGVYEEPLDKWVFEVLTLFYWMLNSVKKPPYYTNLGGRQFA